ncbi:conserved hypothetical protein, partial [Ricinus communis]
MPVERLHQRRRARIADLPERGERARRARLDCRARQPHRLVVIAHCGLAGAQHQQLQPLAAQAVGAQHRAQLGQADRLTIGDDERTFGAPVERGMCGQMQHARRTLRERRREVRTVEIGEQHAIAPRRHCCFGRGAFQPGEAADRQ